MGQATQDVVDTIRATGRGSEYFGSCEICKQSCSEVFVQESHRVFVRDDGVRYLGARTAGVYGHARCVSARHGVLVDKASLPRIGNLTAAPVQ